GRGALEFPREPAEAQQRVPLLIVFGTRRLAGAAAIIDVEQNEVAQKGRAFRFRRVADDFFNRQRAFRAPGGLEAVAGGVHALGHLRGQGQVARLQRVSHLPFPCQSLRIISSLRSTVRSTQPSSAAISALLYPSIFPPATLRSSSLPSASSKRCVRSATAAANAGVGSSPMTRLMPPSRSEPSTASSHADSPRTLPPPRFSRAS